MTSLVWHGSVADAPMEVWLDPTWKPPEPYTPLPLPVRGHATMWQRRRQSLWRLVLFVLAAAAVLYASAYVVVVWITARRREPASPAAYATATPCRYSEYVSCSRDDVQRGGKEE